MGIPENYNAILARKNEAARRASRNPEDVLLLTVTKTHDASEINQAVSAGAIDLGENKVQEILEKYDKVPNARWHMIGHLQTNKVKNIIDKVVLIHSVDSVHLAKEIDKRAGNAGVRMDILIQLNIADEETKTGISVSELRGLTCEIIGSCKNLRICGLMCVPPRSDNPEGSRKYFRKTRELLDDMKTWGYDEANFRPKELSMGMSGDFEVAIEEGSTIVRVGSQIMGRRNYR